MSCTSAGNCVAAGFSLPRGRGEIPVAVVERNGTWGKAFDLPGVVALGVNQGDQNVLVSYDMAFESGDQFLPGAAFAVSEVNGHWGSPVANAAWKLRQLNSVSCTKAVTQCGAGGFSTDDTGHEQTFVVDRT